MNKIIKGLFYLSVMMLLVSCATTRFEPKDNGDCLIIGRLEVECEGWNDDVGMLNIDGVYKRGATISTLRPSDCESTSFAPRIKLIPPPVSE